MEESWGQKYGPGEIQFPERTRPDLERESKIEAEPEYLKMHPGQVRAFLVTMFRQGEMTEAYIKEKLAEIGYHDEVFFETKQEKRFVEGVDEDGKKIMQETKVPINRVRIKLPDANGNITYIEI